MDKIVPLALALVTGGLLGAMFFGGLWWTVNKGLSSKRLALLFFGSLLLRTVLALVGFYLVAGGHWQRLLSCLLGFIVARHFITRHFGPPIEDLNPQRKEAGHAA
jgi:F1F0 ATPase subunit 2